MAVLTLFKICKKDIRYAQCDWLKSVYKPHAMLEYKLRLIKYASHLGFGCYCSYIQRDGINLHYKYTAPRPVPRVIRLKHEPLWRLSHCRLWHWRQWETSKGISQWNAYREATKQSWSFIRMIVFPACAVPRSTHRLTYLYLVWHKRPGGRKINHTSETKTQYARRGCIDIKSTNKKKILHYGEHFDSFEITKKEKKFGEIAFCWQGNK